MRTIELPQGTLCYRDSGTGGEVVVLLHGLLVGGELWGEVVRRLEGKFRVIVPDLPLGAHTVALKPTADRSPAGMAQLIADLLEALDLREVTLVGNDSGGALCQLVAVRHSDRVARIVLTPCDAFEVFPPALFKPLAWAARLPGGLTAYIQPLRLRPLRRLPIAFGWLTKRGIEPAVVDRWVKAYFGNAGVRRDVTAFVRAAKPRVMKDVGARLATFRKPVLVAWASEDRHFKWTLGERLAAAFPNARLERIEDSYTFVAVDQPERTARLIHEFVRETSGAPA
ncbi:MAG TPA: alpha/beta fold hydrolase [Steroidobacteraceae bacterium]|nr:alpha/beta fold hydrolase [Steroidobacteraceae bacterium]